MNLFSKLLGRSDPAGPSAVQRSTLAHERDKVFTRIYAQGMEKSGTPTDSRKRRDRFYNLAQLFFQTAHLSGDVAECGCWKGLSSFILCHYTRLSNPAFQGAGYHIFDSFSGLSAPSEQDFLSRKTVDSLTRVFGRVEGAFAATLDEVKLALSDFPEIDFHPGWIPESLSKVSDARYRFVHIDLDLYEPIKGALAYWYPRLVDHGMIVSDDYGSPHWPGAKKALDEFAAQHGSGLLRNASGQAIIWKGRTVASPPDES